MEMNCTTMPEMAECQEDPNGASDMHMHGMDMNMWFEFSTSAVVLFKKWDFDGVGGLLASMVGIFLLAFSFEAIKYFRDQLHTRSLVVLKNNRGAGDFTILKPRMMSKTHAIQTFLHGIQIIISYFLMLIFMTYNAWLCIAVVLGEVSGYFLFGWRKSTPIDDTHCG